MQSSCLRRRDLSNKSGELTFYGWFLEDIVANLFNPYITSELALFAFAIFEIILGC